MSDQKDFETSLKQLENIVEELERGNLPLEDALKSFEQGVKLARHCSSMLDKAEKRIRVLTQDGEQGWLSEDDDGC